MVTTFKNCIFFLALVLFMGALLVSSIEAQAELPFYKEYEYDTSDTESQIVELDLLKLSKNGQLYAVKFILYSAGGGAGGNIPATADRAEVLGGDGMPGARFEYIFPITTESSLLSAKFGAPGKGAEGKTGAKKSNIDVEGMGSEGADAGKLGEGGGGGAGADSTTIRVIPEKLPQTTYFAVLGGGAGGAGATIGFESVRGMASENKIGGSLTIAGKAKQPLTEPENGEFKGGGAGGSGGSGYHAQKPAKNGIEGKNSATPAYGGWNASSSPKYKRMIGKSYVSVIDGGSLGGKASGTLSERDGAPAKLVVTNSGFIAGTVFEDKARSGEWNRIDPIFTFNSDVFVKLFRAKNVREGNPSCDTKGSVLTSLVGETSYRRADSSFFVFVGEMLQANGEYCIMLTATDDVNDRTPLQYEHDGETFSLTNGLDGVRYVTLDSKLVVVESPHLGVGSTTQPTPTFSIGGRVFDDINSDGIWNGNDTATGLDLYIKLVNSSSPSSCPTKGTAVNVVKVAEDGTYTISGVTNGNYCIILSANESADQLTPYKTKSGWWYTQHAGGVIHGIVVNSENINDNNFGLTQTLLLHGRIFIDNGAEGIAYDGIPQGKEAGVDGVQIQLVRPSSADTEARVLANTTSNAAGEYVIAIPKNTTDNSLSLRVIPSADKVFVSQCLYRENLTSTDKSCINSSDEISYERLNLVASNLMLTDQYYFGLGNLPIFQNDSSHYTKPGQFVHFSQRFQSNAPGILTLNYEVQGEELESFILQPLIYLDNNCDGKLDDSDVLVSDQLAILLNEQKCFITRIVIPYNYPIDGHYIIGNLIANFSYGDLVNSTKHMSSVRLTAILSDEGAGVSLFKKVDKATAKPGEILSYTIEYRNLGDIPVVNLVIRDKLADYTDLVLDSIKCESADQPINVTCSVSAPDSGSIENREIKWSFNNPIPPFSSGRVRYQLKLQL